MEYQISESVAGSIALLRTTFVKNTVFATFVTLLFTAKYYFYNDQVADFRLFVFIVMFILCICGMQYYTISSKGDIINNTATDVAIEDNAIIITTYPFKGLYFINRPSKNLRFDTSDIEIRKVPYPVKQVYDLDENAFKQTFDYRVFKLNDGKNEAYILLDFFDTDLKGSIKNLKV